MRGVTENFLLNIDQSSEDFLIAAALKYRPADSFYNLSLNWRIKGNDSIAIICLRKAIALDSIHFKAKRDLDSLLKKQAEKKRIPNVRQSAVSS